MSSSQCDQNVVTLVLQLDKKKKRFLGVILVQIQ